MKLLQYLFLTAFLFTTQVFAEDGVNGKSGENGQTGKDGKAGTVTIAQGCEQTLLKTLTMMSDTYMASDWEDLTSWMCGSAYQPGPELDMQLHQMANKKITNLLATGFFEVNVPEFKDSSLQELGRKVAFLNQLYQLIEKASLKTVCRDAIVEQANGRQVTSNICHETKVSMEGDDLIFNLTFDSDRLRYTVELKTPPKTCTDGTPIYSATRTGIYSQTKETWTHEIVSACDKLTSSYSAIYPNFIFNYK